MRSMWPLVLTRNGAEDVMTPEYERFDVWVRSVPIRTPQGVEFATALARVFGVELWMAEHIARNAPAFVKRGVPLDVADRVSDVLERLGAEVEVRSAVAPSVRPPAAWPPGLPTDSPHASPSLPPPPERLYRIPPPRPSARFSPPPPAPLSLRPTAPPTTAPPTARSWTPLPPFPQRGMVSLSRGGVLFLVAAALALSAFGLTRWVHRFGDAYLLGNTPNEETACGSHYGLTGPGIGLDRRAKLTLVVAWRTGCLSDDYRRFLQDLADSHRDDLAIVGAGLVARGHSPQRIGKTTEPPPDPWPPAGCEPGFEMLPIDRGYVSDSLSPPATYLYDRNGVLIAAWRGGMSPQQRERLATWLNGRTWDEANGANEANEH